MTYFDMQQQNPAFNPQFNPQQWAAAQPYGAWNNAPLMQAIGGHGLGGYGQGGYGLGHAAYGQQYGQYGGQPGIGAFGYNAPQGWGQQQPQWAQWGGQQQRQLSQQDVNEVVRQLAPALPQILAQAQQPYGAIGHAAFGQAPRQLSQQDVIGQQGFGQQGLGQYGLGQYGQGQFGQGNPAQSFGTPFGLPQFQSAFGGAQSGWGPQQRQLTQQDVADVTRQLIGVIPQVIGNLQALNQPRMI
jgi:hypothetical protein